MAPFLIVVDALVLTTITTCARDYNLPTLKVDGCEFMMTPEMPKGNKFLAVRKNSTHRGCVSATDQFLKNTVIENILTAFAQYCVEHDMLAQRCQHVKVKINLDLILSSLLTCNPQYYWLESTLIIAPPQLAPASSCSRALLAHFHPLSSNQRLLSCTPRSATVLSGRRVNHSEPRHISTIKNNHSSQRQVYCAKSQRILVWNDVA